VTDFGGVVNRSWLGNVDSLELVVSDEAGRSTHIIATTIKSKISDVLSPLLQSSIEPVNEFHAAL
jgi:hypothetical protein